MSLHGAPRLTVLAFSSGVVLIVLGINIAFDSAKKRAREVPESNFAAPTFAVPSIPGASTVELENPRG